MTKPLKPPAANPAKNLNTVATPERSAGPNKSEEFPHLTYWTIGVLIHRANLPRELGSSLELGRKVRYYIRGEEKSYQQAAAILGCETEWAEICHRKLLAWLRQQYFLIERRDFL